MRIGRSAIGRSAAVGACLVALATGCGSGSDAAPPTTATSSSTAAPASSTSPGSSPATPTTAGDAAASTSTSSTSSGSTSTAPVTSTTSATSAGREPVVVRLRFESHVADVDVAAFSAVATAALTDPRGWTRAGFRFTFADDAPYRVVLAEPREVDAGCAPYGTSGRYSCQNGPVVWLNADRWRSGVAHWNRSLADYRTMLVNHEVGHLLGQHHVSPPCKAAGAPAAVMAQQTKSLGGCAANPWPLDWEITCAASGDEPLAPPYDPSPARSCRPPSP